MPRFFNTAGPCDPEIHYMLPPEQRLPRIRPLIDERAYFVVHAPRQSGKVSEGRSRQSEGRSTLSRHPATGLRAARA